MPSYTGLTDRLQATSGHNMRDMPTVRSLARIPPPNPRPAMGSRPDDQDGLCGDERVMCAAQRTNCKPADGIFNALGCLFRIGDLGLFFRTAICPPRAACSK